MEASPLGFSLKKVKSKIKKTVSKAKTQSKKGPGKLDKLFDFGIKAIGAWRGTKTAPEPETVYPGGGSEAAGPGPRGAGGAGSDLGGRAGAGVGGVLDGLSQAVNDYPIVFLGAGVAVALLMMQPPKRGR